MSAGAVGLIAPNRFVSDPIEEFEVDGVRMIFQNTPNTEAPREMNTYIPDMKALWMAENVIASLHNIYTLRGAPVRDPLAWSKYIGEALYRYGLEAEVMFASHHWPRWGNDRIQEVLRGQRDLYANMNNQVLHLANQGVTINQIHNVYELPKGLQEKWYCRGYHGSPEHNARGVIQRYLGFWDCNPTTLIPLSPAELGPALRRDDGRRPTKILARGRELHDTGDYLLASEIVNKLVQAEPDNAGRRGTPRRHLRADSATSRRTPACATASSPPPTSSGTASRRERPRIPSTPDVIRAMSTELFLNFLGIRMDSRKAEGLRFTINLATPDNGETFLIEMENATLTNIQGFQADNPDLTLTINRTDLEQTMMGAKTLDAQLADGTAKAEGDTSVLAKLAATMVDFDPRFEIMPGTKAPAGTAVAHANPYQAVPEQVIAE